ncbi:MAG: hypothetical protein HDR71_15990 [Lachnospiraceae bacterium]|nr:hypothetical protein [Lachnospiraceae bacterium]
MYYIGIDLGSTYIKSALLNIEEGRVEKYNRYKMPSRIQNRKDCYYEISALEILKSILYQVDELAREYSGIRGIILSTQMHGFVYCVKGREDTYVSWQDTRCLNQFGKDQNTYMDVLDKLISEELKSSGVHMKTSLGVCNLYTLLKEEKLRSNGELHTLGSYLIHKMTGNNACHITNGAPLGLVNIVEREWNSGMIDKLGFSGMHFPKLIKEDTEVCGVYRSSGQEIPVYADFGDQQCAVLGSMCTSEDAVINIATASQVSVIDRHFSMDHAYEVRPYFAGRYLKTISNMPSGRNLEVLTGFIQNLVKEFTGITLDTEQIWEIIASSYHGNASGLMVDMTFYQERGGSISGITASNFGVYELFAAVFQGMAQVYWENICKLRDADSIKRLICAGGVSWKRLELIEAIRNISGKECIRSTVQDEVLFGIFRIALVCEKLCDDFDKQPDIILKA